MSSAAILRPARSRSEACVRSGVEERPTWEAGFGGEIEARSKNQVSGAGRRGASNGAASPCSFSLGARGLERIREDAPEKEPEAAPGERVGLWSGGWLRGLPRAKACMPVHVHA